MTDLPTAYEASPIKRERATRSQMEARQRGLLDILAEQRPMTVRQCFYQATVRGLIDKTEAGYAKVQRLLADMRRAKAIPYDWIADNTRWMRKPESFTGIEQALVNTASLYRKNLWADAGAYCEVWLEKDALAGVISEETYQFDVPLMVSRGYASLSFLHSAAEALQQQDRPCFIYHVGDHDPSGVNAAEKIEQTLRELAPGVEIHFDRLAVLPWQIHFWNLPSRPTKASDTRAKNWTGGDSVEVDAIPPHMLRGLVSKAITRHLPADELRRLREIEAEERRTLREYAAAWRR